MPKKSLQNSIVSLQYTTTGLPVDCSKNIKFCDFFPEINSLKRKNFIIFKIQIVCIFTKKLKKIFFKKILGDQEFL